MSQSENHQIPPHATLIYPQESSTAKSNDRSNPLGRESVNGNYLMENRINYTKTLEEEIQKVGFKIEHHKDNMKFLKAEIDKIDETIFDMQVVLGKYRSSSASTVRGEKSDQFLSEENTIDQILQKENSAAGLLCYMKKYPSIHAPCNVLTKDVLGIVATLGKVNGENLSRLFSEYLGLGTMMAIVCKTLEGVEALETYDNEGKIIKSNGLHLLGLSIGKHIDGRFLAICLEELRPYAGDFVADDPQRKLALLKPTLPNGECPPGFLGFAVNMIDIESANVSYLTTKGQGLRETLFYSLFAHLQVYETRSQMQHALPCISEGALSLDGGMIRNNGVFALGNRNEVEVRFPSSSGKVNLPTEYLETQEQVKLLQWERERLNEDKQREEALLNQVQLVYEHRKDSYIKIMAHGVR